MMPAAYAPWFTELLMIVREQNEQAVREGLTLKQEARAALALTFTDGKKLAVSHQPKTG